MVGGRKEGELANRFCGEAKKAREELEIVVAKLKDAERLEIEAHNTQDQALHEDRVNKFIADFSLQREAVVRREKRRQKWDRRVQKARRQAMEETHRHFSNSAPSTSLNIRLKILLRMRHSGCMLQSSESHHDSFF